MGNCIICRKKLNKHIATFHNMPKAAQNMPDAVQIKIDAGITLELYECTGCGLVQFDISPVDYYKDVIRATRVSEKFRRLRIQQFEHFIALCGLQNKKIVEIGCGGGEFLEILRKFPVKVYGTEHNRNLLEHARNLGLNVAEDFVEDGDCILKDAPFDAFISFNFLEHQPNPVGMLQGIYENLTEDGVGLITVPSFEYFQENSSYYEFIRDHIEYYKEDTIGRIVEICGFEVIETNRFNHDTIEMIVRKRCGNGVADYNLQQDSMEKKFTAVIKENGDDAITYVWGASHQAFTLLSTIDSLAFVDKIIDSAAFKWDKYSPVSHKKIVSPEILDMETPDCIIIMAPGYSDEIYQTIISRNANVKSIYSVMGEDIIKLK